MKIIRYILILGSLIASHVAAYTMGDWYAKEPSHLLQLESLVRHEVPLRLKMYKKTKDPQVLRIPIVGTEVVIVAKADGSGVIKVGR